MYKRVFLQTSPIEPTVTNCDISDNHSQLMCVIADVSTNRHINSLPTLPYSPIGSQSQSELRHSWNIHVLASLDEINRGSYISAYVLLNLLNELGKRDKMRGLPSILSLFRNEFNKFNNTRARMLDSIYHMTNTLKSHFWRKNVMILSSCTQRSYGRNNVSRKSINH